MIKAQWAKARLDFRFEAITSRERMWHKDTFFVRVWHSGTPDVVGIGECPLFRGLSADDRPDYTKVLADFCRRPSEWRLCSYPSIRFGFETAMADLEAGGRRLWSDGPWSRGEKGIAINGLVWMGDADTMGRRIAEKLDQGFRVLKLKIGGIDFESECRLLENIRSHFRPADLEIRLDANGSFAPCEAMERLGRLAGYSIHSIEQPLAPGQKDAMRELCRRSPIAIALDEELVGYHSEERTAGLLDDIRPQYVILKPALIGGCGAASVIAEQASARGIGWWATSALESDIGLNAIAQWVDSCNVTVPQGLGTGNLYSNNVPSPLEMHHAALWRNPAGNWGMPDNIEWQD